MLLLWLSLCQKLVITSLPMIVGGGGSTSAVTASPTRTTTELRLRLFVLLSRNNTTLAKIPLQCYIIRSHSLHN